MWTKLKSLFSSKKPGIGSKLSHDFEQQVRQAISLIQHSNPVNTDQEFLKLLTDNGIEHGPAVEILLFLPIAFVRKWIPTANWLDTYVEFIDEKNQIEKKYSETKSYQVIWNVTAEYFANQPDRDTVFKIGGRSAEFNVINQALHANADSKLEDFQLSKTVIMR